jgi:hypothetical protein
LGLWGTPKWTQKGIERPAMGEMYFPMSKLENKPVTKSFL